MATRPTVTMQITTDMKAPVRYGKHAYKVAPSDAFLLLQAGWKGVGQGRDYVYVCPPEGISGKTHTIVLPVPTDAEIEQLALAMHRQGTFQQQVVDGFIVKYYPAHLTRAVTLNFGAALPGQTSMASAKTYQTPATFEFGWRAPWYITLEWHNGPNQPPTWKRHVSSFTHRPDRLHHRKHPNPTGSRPAPFRACFTT